MSVIDATDLTKTYGETTALDGLTLSVGDGELFGFLGPNGAGKTTTIKLLTGRATPDAGSATVLGLNPADNPLKVRAKTGILPEKESPANFMTPREYLHLWGKTRELDEGYVSNRIDEWADRLSYEEKLDTYVTDLSRGQQQKVMITQAFIHEPELVFIDEPLANLDPIMQERVKEFLTEYVEDGNTIFFSTHHIEVAEEICTRVGIVDGGSLVATREPEALEDATLIDAFIEDVSTPE